MKNMKEYLKEDQLNFFSLEEFAPHNDLKKQVKKGFSSLHKSLCSGCFYNYEGSLLFDKICELPEYYLTRTELAVLEDNMGDIIAEIPEEAIITELGNGNPVKIKLFFEALFQRQNRVQYTPIDISIQYMAQSMRRLIEQYPNLQITAIGGRYEDGIHFLQKTDAPKCILWLGSSIGNLTDDEAVCFLSKISRMMQPEDSLLIGMDMIKDWEIIDAAYNDTQGITAAFNMNLLRRINNSLDADFNLAQFRHEPVCNKAESRMESYITSCADQQVSIRDIDMEVAFRGNERIHVEVSCKYSEEKIAAIANRSDLSLKGRWFDTRKWFSLNLFSPA
jgi:dimethylhistidine N-methyltransferase